MTHTIFLTRPHSSDRHPAIQWVAANVLGGFKGIGQSVDGVSIISGRILAAILTGLNLDLRPQSGRCRHNLYLTR